MDSEENRNKEKMTKIMRYKTMSQEHKNIFDNAFEMNYGVLSEKLRLELAEKTGYTKSQVKRYFTEKRQEIEKGSVLSPDNILDYMICTEGDEKPMSVEERVEKAKEYGVSIKQVHDLSYRLRKFQRKGNVDRRKIRGDPYEKLMEAFVVDPYCKEPRLTELAAAIGLKKKTITTWFQNRRAKLGMTDRVPKLHSQAVRMMQEYFDQHGTTPRGHELQMMEKDTNMSTNQIKSWFRREMRKMKKVGAKSGKNDTTA